MADKSDEFDDTNYFSSLKYGRDKGVAQDVHVDMSDAYANYKQYMISFQHAATGATVYFKSFVTEYNESFSCNWNANPVYGRTDPIQNYVGTTRKITLSFDVPASSMSEAYENLGRVSKLVQMLYPTYVSNAIGDGKIIGSAPLVRVKMMNLITKERGNSYEFSKGPNGDSIATFQDVADVNTKKPDKILRNYKTNPNPGNGVLAAIGSVTYRSDLQKIQIFEKDINTVLPQSISVSINFDVIHEETLGWDGPSGLSLADSFPHKVRMATPVDGRAVGDDQNPANISQRIALERENQAVLDQQQAVKNRLIDRLGSKNMGRGADEIYAFTEPKTKDK
jgi:hypothetical protein